MSKDIQRYVKGCMKCQRTKSHRTAKHTTLQPLPIPSTPWMAISIDIIGPLPESKGWDAILVIVDYFTKMKIFIPIMTQISSLGIALILQREVFRKHRLPH